MSSLPTVPAAPASESALPCQRARAAGIAWAALTVSIFPGWFVTMRFSVTRELRVWDITALRFGIGALLLAGTAAGGPPSAAGIGALAAAAAMWAIYTLLFRRSGLAPIESAALICFWSAVLVLPVYGLGDLSRLGHASAGEIALQVVYQGVLMSGVAISTFNGAVSLRGSSAATAIIPAIASLLAIPILGESPSPAEAAAIAVIVAGVLLAARRPDPPEPSGQRG